jgi:prevent-host-death family protein
MKVASVADAKARLGDYLERAQTSGPVVITRKGKAVAVLIAPADEEDLETLVLSRSPRFLAILERSRKSIAEGKGIPAKEFWKIVKERTKQRPSAKRKRAKANSVAP